MAFRLPSWAPTSCTRSSGNGLYRLPVAETRLAPASQAACKAENSRASYSCAFANCAMASLPKVLHPPRLWWPEASEEAPFLDNELVYRQTFAIRSYEVGFDRTAPISTISNLFQETSLNHVGTLNFVGDGMGATRAMIRNRLIWVVTRMHIDMMRYPAWEDIVQIDSWVSSSGKNGMRRDFIVWDYVSGRMLGRATSNWAMMNQDTRRLSKMPEEVREEISQVFLEFSAMEDHDILEKIRSCDESAPLRVTGLAPKIQDLDMNQHVNNVKYIDWVLECIPESLLMSCDLSKMTLEYRRECGRSNIVDSFAQPDMASKNDGSLSFLHSVRLCNSAVEILRCRTQWTPKMPLPLEQRQTFTKAFHG